MTSFQFKRVVTAVDEKGKSVVAEDAPLPYLELAMMPGAKFYSVWGTEDVPTSPVSDPNPVNLPFFPATGGNRFGILVFPPESSATESDVEPDMDALVADAEDKLPGLIGVFEPDSPGMHTTQSVDYDIVLEGELHLELDDGVEVRLPAGSCVIQNGTRHAWHNHGDVPAVLAYVLLGARPGT